MLTGGPAPPKSLFQKTKSDAAKLQKGIYSARMIPPMPVAKSFRVLSSPPSLKLLPPALTPASKCSGSRVTVTAVPAHRTSDDASKASHPRSPQPTKVVNPKSIPQNDTGSVSKPGDAVVVAPSQQLPAVSSKPKIAKKDPMKTLFMPKQRIPPRASVQVTGMASRT